MFFYLAFFYLSLNFSNCLAMSMNNKGVINFTNHAEEMPWHSMRQVPPPTLCSCEGMTAPNVGFPPKVNTTNLSKKFWQNPVNRQRDEQMEKDGSKPTFDSAGRAVNRKTCGGLCKASSLTKTNFEKKLTGQKLCIFVPCVLTYSCQSSHS